jgi:hypothetical protein
VAKKELDNSVKGQMSVLRDGRMYRGVHDWVK